MLGKGAGGVITDKGADVRARAGDNADHRSDQTGDGGNAKNGLEILLAGKQAGNLCLHLILGKNVLDPLKGLTHGEQADHDGDVLDTAHEVIVSFGAEADVAGNGVDADGSDQNAQAAADQALFHILAGDVADDAQAEHRQQEELGRAELQRKLRQLRTDEPQAQHGHKAADIARKRSGAQGASRLALLRQRVAVDGGRGGGGGAGRVEQNGGNGAAVDRAAVNAEEHQNALRRLHTKGHGQQQRNAHRGGQAGQRTDADTGQHAAGHVKEDDGGQGGRKNLMQQFHDRSPP